MDEQVRQIRWLLILRLLTLAAALLLLPSRVSIPMSAVPWLGIWGVGALVLWSIPLWGPFWRQERVVGALGLIEALAISALVYRFGRIDSPFGLLYLPLLGQSAALLRPLGYILTAGYVLAGFGMAIARDLDARYFPLWTPLMVAGMLLMVAWLGLLGEGYRRERLRGDRSMRRFRRYRALVERMPVAGAEEEFWRPFLLQVEQAGGFTDGALVRWEGARPRVIATARQEAWEALVKRHQALLRNSVVRSGSPEIFVEGGAGKQARSIVCWPVPGREGDVGAAGVLCLLAPHVLGTSEAGRRIQPWLPLASLALALGTAHLTLHRAPVDWRVLMNATLHRLHKRLSQYLVLVHVDPGVIEADALLLADAIAHVIEEALDRVPPGSRIHLGVQRGREGWNFQVSTATPARAAAGPPRAGVLLAQQVVAAHGGEWRAMASPQGYMVGFTLPTPEKRRTPATQTE